MIGPLRSRNMPEDSEESHDNTPPPDPCDKPVAI